MNNLPLNKSDTVIFLLLMIFVVAVNLIGCQGSNYNTQETQPSDDQSDIDMLNEAIFEEGVQVSLRLIEDGEKAGAYSQEKIYYADHSCQTALYAVTTKGVFRKIPPPENEGNGEEEARSRVALEPKTVAMLIQSESLSATAQSQQLCDLS